MLLSSPSIFEYRTTPLMAWKKKAISFLSRKAGSYVARRASDYLRRRFARRRSYTARCHQCPGPYITYAKEQP